MFIEGLTFFAWGGFYVSMFASVIVGFIFTVAIIRAIHFEARLNRAELNYGTVLSPYTHKSYSQDKQVLVQMNADLRDAEIEMANREFDRIVNSLK